MATKQKQLKDALRADYVNKFFEFAEKLGEDVGYIASNKFNFPVCDAEGNEYGIEVTIAVPSGARGDNEGYDVYGLREQYDLKVEKNKRRQAEKEKKGK